MCLLREGEAPSGQGRAEAQDRSLLFEAHMASVVNIRTQSPVRLNQMSSDLDPPCPGTRGQGGHLQGLRRASFRATWTRILHNTGSLLAFSGADPEETILNAFKVFDPEGKGVLKAD